MTYVLCDNDNCVHHDGDGCTLEFIEINTTTTRSTEPNCADYQDYESQDD